MVSFISVAFVVVKFVKLGIFKCFHGDAASMKWPLFGGFSAHFNQRYFFYNTKTVSEQSFKIKCLSGNDVPKVNGFGPFFGPILPSPPRKKNKNIAKNQIFFPETMSS